MQKLVSASIIAVIAASMMLAVSLTPMTVEAKKPVEKCNNVKIRVNVTGVEAGQKVTASATLGNKTVTKNSNSRRERNEYHCSPELQETESMSKSRR
jgi:hypothetical protein